CARTFFSGLTFAHRGDARVRNEERVRATVDSLAHTAAAAADLTGALDIIESSLVRLKPDTTRTRVDDVDVQERGRDRTSSVQFPPDAKANRFQGSGSVRHQPDANRSQGSGSVRLQPDRGPVRDREPDEGDSHDE